MAKNKKKKKLVFKTNEEIALDLLILDQQIAKDRKHLNQLKIVNFEFSRLVDFLPAISELLGYPVEWALDNFSDWYDCEIERMNPAEMLSIMKRDVERKVWLA